MKLWQKGSQFLSISIQALKPASAIRETQDTTGTVGFSSLSHKGVSYSHRITLNHVKTHLVIYLFFFLNEINLCKNDRKDKAEPWMKNTLFCSIHMAIHVNNNEWTMHLTYEARRNSRVNHCTFPTFQADSKTRSNTTNLSSGHLLLTSSERLSHYFKPCNHKRSISRIRFIRKLEKSPSSLFILFYSPRI